MNLGKVMPPNKGNSNVQPLVQGNSEFALRLYQSLRTQKGNLFFSPYSISSAIAMTYAGARGNTAVEMAQALRYPADVEAIHPAFAALGAKLGEIAKKGYIQLLVANALFAQQGSAFQEAFLDLVKHCYDAMLNVVDYGDAQKASAIINAWVEEKTGGKIRDLVSPGLLDRMTRLVLVNAIYFKGNWANQFDASLTLEAPFWLGKNEQKQTPMMSKLHHFRYAADDDLQILELPYAGKDLSMIVLLPKEVDGLTQLEERLSVENLDNWLKKLSSREIQLTLPRFEITFPFQLNETLISMGMVDAFNDASDFSGMDGTRLLYIAAVLHKAFVAVNEEGTEAAAATAVVMMARSLPPPPVVFRADHPFIFLIRENGSGSILFLGRLVDP